MIDKPDRRKTAGTLADRLQRIAGTPALDNAQYHGDLTPRQRAPRQDTFKPAAITMVGGARMNVVVKNISSTGAKIEFVPKVTLPKEVLVAEPTLRIRTWATVVWQSGSAAGLQFVGA